MVGSQQARHCWGVIIRTNFPVTRPIEGRVDDVGAEDPHGEVRRGRAVDERLLEESPPATGSGPAQTHSIPGAGPDTVTR